uniref:Uncharacterized protein n=1 Tax=Rhizophora mucronata TaxID=61149 RepID=A0A2P2PN18_RHIMU
MRLCCCCVISGSDSKENALLEACDFSIEGCKSYSQGKGGCCMLVFPFSHLVPQHWWFGCVTVCCISKDCAKIECSLSNLGFEQKHGTSFDVWMLCVCFA